VIEDMFSIIVMARINGAGEEAFLRYELGKDKWHSLGEPKTLLLKLPADELMLMR
jgi:hypothetical protein